MMTCKYLYKAILDRLNDRHPPDLVQRLRRLRNHPCRKHNLRIQNYLRCCGCFSPYVEATVSETCYSRSVLPGCKKACMDSQNHFLGIIWCFAFAIVPAQILVMITALLCSNHVTYRFGKGMMPAAYRLKSDSMAGIMDRYAAQLADQYSADVANRVLKKSRPNLNLLVLQKNGGGYGTDDSR
ncbi:hypothetical protein BKA70DRAFT_48767 [Coprinopsis sp. MPI-PUGE-AT-0042]|nr:hypothetical protein BKA70DRAFT_48767 [Coprinopsis sp. MPI-PUGE-AT-0042]